LCQGEPSLAELRKRSQSLVQSSMVRSVDVHWHRSLCK
jgi:hypothetical protein